MELLTFTRYDNRLMCFLSDTITRTEVSRIDRDWTKVFYMYYDEDYGEAFETYVAIKHSKSQVDFILQSLKR